MQFKCNVLRLVIAYGDPWFAYSNNKKNLYLPRTRHEACNIASFLKATFSVLFWYQLFGKWKGVVLNLSPNGRPSKKWGIIDTNLIYGETVTKMQGKMECRDFLSAQSFRSRRQI